jgi:hypothetical protein
MNEGPEALFRAVIKANVDVVKIELKKYGANPDIEFCGETPLQALLSVYMKGSKLFAFGMDIPDEVQVRRPEELEACSEIIELLLDSGADPCVIDHSGNTLIHLSAQCGYPFNIIERLIYAGADCGSENKFRNTPADLARGEIKTALEEEAVAISIKSAKRNKI